MNTPEPHQDAAGLHTLFRSEHTNTAGSMPRNTERSSTREQKLQEKRNIERKAEKSDFTKRQRRQRQFLRTAGL